jgi:prepilin-type N-terminal cleavage/methylation domain-containing protein
MRGQSRFYYAHSAPLRESSRKAFTLFEMVLVLAVMVVLAAALYPSLEAMYGDSKVTAAGDMVRGLWAEAQSHAINEARPYRFAVLYYTGTFRVAPDTSDYWGGSADAEAPPYDPANPILVKKDTLPKGVKFEPAETQTTNAADQSVVTQANQQNSGDNNGSWSRVVTFLPDGSARDDKALILNSRGARPLEIRIRGLTGVVTTKNLEAKRP